MPNIRLRQYSDGDPLTGAKIAIFDQQSYLAFASMTAGPSSVVINSWGVVIALRGGVC